MGFPLRGVEPGVQQGHTYLARSTGRCEPASRTSPGWPSRAVAGLTVDDVYRTSEFRGRMLDSFITAQLRVEAEASGRVRLYHLRTENGDHEIDLVAERGPSLFAFEYKAGRSPARADARHLLWFRDHVAGDRFRGGVLFHTGPHRYEIDRDIEAVPVAGLWGPDLPLAGR